MAAKAREREMVKHYIACSGGKDSVAMGLLLEEREREIDFTWLFFDSGIEFPSTLKVIEKLARKRDIKVIKPSISWDEQFYKEVKGREKDKAILKGERERDRPEPQTKFFKICGWPTWKKRWCNRIFKIDPSKKILKPGDIYYLGIAVDEIERTQPKYRTYRKDIILKYPLVEWGMTQKDCMEFCRKKGLLADLYKHFDRSSCLYCPFRKIKEWYNLYKFYPEVWKKMLQYEKDSPQKTQRNPYNLLSLDRRFKAGKIFLRKPVTIE